MTDGHGEIGETNIWEEPHLGGYPDPSWLGLSGLERMKLGREGGRVPFPPMSYLVEMGFTEVSKGSAAFTIPRSPWFANSAGVIPGGMLAVLADAPLGASIHSELAPGVAFTTAEISLTFLRPVRPDPESVISGSGQVIHSGRSMALSEAFMINEGSDELVAHGTSRCSVFPPVDPLPEPPDDPPMVQQPLPGESPDHPLRRPVRGELTPQEVFDRMSGLEFLRAQIVGKLTPPPIHYLTGVRLVEAEDGRASHVLPCSPWLSTGMRTVQGGFTAMLAELTLSAAAFTTVEPGVAIAPLDLKINFLRPVLPDMCDLTAKAEVIHQGRTLAIASCRVTNADGKPVAVATGSSMYLPGRPASLIGVEQLGPSDAGEAGA
jgi:uncharacterized protein (TIGR00369 family)